MSSSLRKTEKSLIVIKVNYNLDLPTSSLCGQNLYKMSMGMGMGIGMGMSMCIGYGYGYGYGFWVWVWI